MTSLDLTAKGMWDEHEASRVKKEAFMFAHDEMVARFHGYYYRDKVKGRTQEPANPAFELLATMQSNVLAGTPQCLVSSARSDDPEGEMKALYLQYTANRLARESRLKETARKLLTDFFFHGAYSVIENKRYDWSDPGTLDGPPRRPSWVRCSPKLIREDARVMDWDDTKWRSYGGFRSIKAMIDHGRKNPDEGWRLDELNALVPDSDQLRKLMSSSEGEGLQRDDVLVWCVWVPDEELETSMGIDNGFYGTIHTYAQTGTKQRARGRAPFVEIREPFPSYAGRHGPVNRWGQYYVPDQVEPLSVMIAIEHIARSMSKTQAVIERAKQAYKRVIINGTADKSLGAKLLKLPHLHMLYAKGFNHTMMKDYIMGGLDPVIMAAMEFDADMLQKRSGIGMTVQGQARRGVTATADTIAAGGAQARQDDIRDMFYDGWTRGWQTFIEVLDNESRFHMNIPPSALREMSKRLNVPMSRMPTAIQGGRPNGGSLDDYEITVAPMSMRYKSEIDVRNDALADMEMWLKTGPASVMNPHLDWPAIYGDYADATGNAKLPSRFNQVVAEQLATLMLLAGNQVEGMYTRGPGLSRPRAPQGEAVMASPGSSTGSGSKGSGGGPQGSSYGSGSRAPKAGSSAPKMGGGMPGRKSGSSAGGAAKSKAKSGKMR